MAPGAGAKPAGGAMGDQAAAGGVAGKAGGAVDKGARRRAVRGPRREAESLVAAWTVMMEDPNFIRLQSAQQKAKFAARYAGLFKQLGLDTAQQDQFTNLLVQRANIASDLAVSAEKEGQDIAPGSPVFAAAVDDAKSAIQDQLTLPAPARAAWPPCSSTTRTSGARPPSPGRRTS